jgi:hypothetical protein
MPLTPRITAIICVAPVALASLIQHLLAAIQP